MTASEHIVIVGAGHAGGRVAQHLRECGYPHAITMVGDEPGDPYERPALSKEFLLGQADAASLAIAPQTFWATANVRRLRARASGLDAVRRTLTVDDGTTLPFDRLVVATGGRARRARVPGGDTPGIHTLRTLEDSARLREALQGARRAVIVGAGVIGMECAASAAAMGVKVTVLEAGAGILGRCLPAPVARWLAGVHLAKGVRIFTNVQVTGVSHDPSAHWPWSVAATMPTGEPAEYHADVVLCAIGIDCSVDFLTDSGIGTRDGVLVDERCSSPVAPWCLAAGDVALTPHPRYGAAIRQETWRNAENQARAVAEFLMGRHDPYVETPWMWTDQWGHNIQVVGHPDPGDEWIIRESDAHIPAATFFLREGRLAGGALIDCGRDRRYLERLVDAQANLDVARLRDRSISLKSLAQEYV